MGRSLHSARLPGVGDDSTVSPKDRFLTVYGRKPVLEALADRSLRVDKVILADTARGPNAAEILRAAEAAELLTEAGYALYALGASARTTVFNADLRQRAAFVLGGETAGVGAEVAELVTEWLSIPMPGDVESLNVSAAVAVLSFELVRRTR